MNLHNILDKTRIVRAMFTSSFSTMLLASVAMLIGTLIDGVLIGNFLHTNDMAAYGIVHPVTILLLAVTGIFSSGSQLLCTKHMSAGESEKANGVFSLTFGILLIVSGIFTAVFIIFAEPIVGLLGASGDLLPLGRDYLLGLAVGFPAILLVTTLAPFAQLEGNQKIAITAVSGMVIVNIAGDLLNAIVFKGGLLGMGIATSVGSYVALLIALIHFLTNKKGYHLTIRHLNWRTAHRIILPGLPTAGGRLFATFRTLFLNYLLITISTSSAVAAYSARMNIGTFFAATGAAAGMSTLSLTGIFYGEEDRTSISKMFNVVTVNSVIISVVIMVFLLFLSDPIMGLYMNADADTLALSARALRFCAVSLPFYTINNILTNYLQAINRIVFTNVLMFCQNLAFCVLPALLLAPFIGTDAVWGCYIIGEVATTALYLLTAYIFCLKKAPVNRNLLMLPDSFGIADDELTEGTITSADDLNAAASDLELFALSRGSDKDRTSVVCTAFKEMANNIITYGFGDGKKHTIDYRVFKKDDDYIIRLRDDCTSFNPISRLADINLDGGAPRTGIRIASVTAKDISCIKLMNMNNLILVV